MKTSKKEGGGVGGSDGRLADCCEEFVAVISLVVLQVSYSPATTAVSTLGTPASKLRFRMRGPEFWEVMKPPGNCHRFQPSARHHCSFSCCTS